MAAASRKLTTWLVVATAAVLSVAGLTALPAEAALPPVDCNVARCITGDVPGNVTAGTGETLRITDAYIYGNLRTNGAKEVIVCNTRIGSFARIEFTTGVVIFGGPDCAGNRTGSDLVLSRNLGGVTAQFNTIGDTLFVLHNTNPVTVNTNDVHTRTVTIPPTYNALTPARILDTRPGLLPGDGFEDKVPPNTTIDMQVLDRGGVPASGVKSVAINVTVTEPSDPSFLTVWAAGTPRPGTSNLNFVGGQTVANLVVVQVGGNGKVSIFNANGGTHVVVDVLGWIPDTADYTPITPVRATDTRGTGTLAPGETRSIPLTGGAGIPSTGVAAVAITVTVTNPTANGFLTVFPEGTARPTASTLNFGPGQTVPNFVIAKVGTGGRVNFFNSHGNTDLIIDVVAWIPTSSDYTALSPARILDTRPLEPPNDGNDVPLGPGQTRDVLVVGRDGVPTVGVGAVVINLTMTLPTSNSYLTVWPNGQAQPNASSINFSPGQTVANLIIAKVGTDGKIKVFNLAGDVHVIMDVVGWLPPA